MEDKRSVFELLKAADTPERAKLRRAENPVYRDCYGNRVGSQLDEAISKKENDRDVRKID